MDAPPLAGAQAEAGVWGELLAASSCELTSQSKDPPWLWPLEDTHWNPVAQGNKATGASLPANPERIQGPAVTPWGHGVSTAKTRSLSLRVEKEPQRPPCLHVLSN